MAQNKPNNNAWQTRFKAFISQREFYFLGTLLTIAGGSLYVTGFGMGILDENILYPYFIITISIIISIVGHSYLIKTRNNYGILISSIMCFFLSYCVWRTGYIIEKAKEGYLALYMVTEAMDMTNDDYVIIFNNLSDLGSVNDAIFMISISAGIILLCIFIIRFILSYKRQASLGL